MLQNMLFCCKMWVGMVDDGPTAGLQVRAVVVGPDPQARPVGSLKVCDVVRILYGVMREMPILTQWRSSS